MLVFIFNFNYQNLIKCAMDVEVHSITLSIITIPLVDGVGSSFTNKLSSSSRGKEI